MDPNSHYEAAGIERRTVSLVQQSCVRFQVRQRLLKQSVFVPSGPAPTAGFVYHLKGEFVHIIDYPVDQALRTIISMGAGSKDLVELLNKKRINK